MNIFVLFLFNFIICRLNLFISFKLQKEKEKKQKSSLFLIKYISENKIVFDSIQDLNSPSKIRKNIYHLNIWKRSFFIRKIHHTKI